VAANLTRSYRLLVAATLLLGVVGVAIAADEPKAKAEADHAHGAADHGHGHDEPGHPKAGSPALKPDEIRGDLALWTFVVFLILLGILWKFAWGPITVALAKREEAIHAHLAAAERSHEEAKAMLAEYERKLASATDEVRAMLEEARRDAEQTKQQILVEAKAGAEAERARALRDVEAATDAALKQIGERSANLAVELAGKIVGAKLSAADHSRLISEAVTKFPTTSPSNN
jgi:F-type H+-transporting ATPase subunit b